MFRHIDWLLLVAVLMLTILGSAAIYSVDLSTGDTLTLFPTQMISFGLGIVLLIAGTLFHKTYYERMARPAYIVALVLLVLVLIFGTTVRGTTGWFRVAGFSFQPSELAKIALILALAQHIVRQRREFRSLFYFFGTMFTTLLLVGLILLQPDLGSASVLILIWFGLMLLTGTRKLYIWGSIILAILVVIFSWFFLFQDYQKDRVLTIFDPDRDALGSGYNIRQSLIAVGSGGLVGRGLGFGSQSQLHFLPEAQTDFIFPVIAEELGFVGSGAILILFVIVLWRLARIAYKATDDFAAFVTLGIALVFGTHMLLNIGGSLGVLPLTGVPLPFVSYGGSSLIMSYLMIGIAQSMAKSGEIETIGYFEA